MKKLKHKIIIAAFGALVIVFSLTMLLSSLGMQYINARSADEMTAIIESNDGQVPERRSADKWKPEGLWRYVQINAESMYRTRYFVVYFNDDGEVSAVDIEHIAAVDEDSAESYAKKALKAGSATGNIENYRFRIAEDNYVIVLDCSDNNDALRSNMLIIAIVCIFFTIVIMLVFSLLAGRVVRPFEENNRKQKQFITDASHELKTPLAIISANAEVLSYKDGENEWIKNITGQVGRMSSLINELLVLTRLEEIDSPKDFTRLDLSSIVSETAHSFDEVFAGKGMEPEYDIEENVSLCGNDEQLRRLVSVLTENASKYASENGEVKISLSSDSRHAKLTVFNTCELDENFDSKRLFDRFYRPDSSRTSKTGGHGIGLSIAKEITALHGGKIEAKPQDGGITFTATISRKLKETKKK